MALYGAAAASKRTKLRWLKKARRKQKYLARCRAKLGMRRSRGSSRAVAATRPLVTRTLGPAMPEFRQMAFTAAPRMETPFSRPEPGEGDNPYRRHISHSWSRPSSWAQPNPMSFSRNPNGVTGASLVSTVRPGDRVTIVDERGHMRVGRAVMPSSHGGWVLNLGGAHGTPGIADESNIVRVSQGRQRANNPELLVMSNPGRRRRSGRVSGSLHVRGRRAMRRRRRNLPLTVRIGGRKHTWRALVKKHGVKGARKYWRGKKKFHGYSRKRVAANRRRRRRNSWRGHRKGHRRAALKGWRRRRKGGRRRRRASSRRRGGRRSSRRARRGSIRYGKRYYSRKALIRKLGKRRVRKLLKKRGRRVNFNRRRFRRRRKN